MKFMEWNAVESNLRAHGFASLGQILTAGECQSIREMYPRDELFRTRIQMERYRFGKGAYGYFTNPLPPVIQHQRETLYTGLAPIASRWMADLRTPNDYPSDLTAFLALCHLAGQTRPTPLLLQYVEGDYNCLHQDVYGAVVFPFQVIVALSRPGIDFEGGELLLVEQRPRAQSIGHVIPISQGEAVAITTRYRPVEGSRGFYRANVKHGVSRIRAGSRQTLGLIFHNAK